MGRYGKVMSDDSNTWGERTRCDVEEMSRQQGREALGSMIPVSSDDVCDAECAKWEKDWRNQSLAAKGLRDFDGTGETAEDGVSFTDSMYDQQSVGKNYGRKY